MKQMVATHRSSKFGFPLRAFFVATAADDFLKASAVNQYRTLQIKAGRGLELQLISVEVSIESQNKANKWRENSHSAAGDSITAEHHRNYPIGIRPITTAFHLVEAPRMRVFVGLKG